MGLRVALHPDWARRTLLRTVGRGLSTSAPPRAEAIPTEGLCPACLSKLPGRFIHSTMPASPPASPLGAQPARALRSHGASPRSPDPQCMTNTTSKRSEWHAGRRDGSRLLGLGDSRAGSEAVPRPLPQVGQVQVGTRDSARCVAHTVPSRARPGSGPALCFPEKGCCWPLKQP